MKAYTNYRVGLFIGLLSFNILSACVHTRQALGVNNRRHDECCPNLNCPSLKRVCNGCCSVLKPTKRCLTTVGVVLLLGGGAIWLLNHSRSHEMVPSANNGSNLTTFRPFIPITTMTPEQAENITNVLENGEEKWGSTTEKPSTTTTSTTTTIASTTTTASTTTERLSSTTTQKPDCGVKKVDNSMVLDHEVIMDLEFHKFSIERIQCWLTTGGLSIDAKHPSTEDTLYDICSTKKK